jgi:hypothetical protein
MQYPIQRRVEVTEIKESIETMGLLRIRNEFLFLSNTIEVANDGFLILISSRSFFTVSKYE